MKHGLILMFMLSLLGHIAAAGMLYVVGAYGVRDKHPRYGTDDQRKNAVRVLWGFAEETPMSRGLTKDDENTLPVDWKSGGRDKGGDGVFSSETSMSPDSQRSKKIEGGVIARAEGPKQSLNVAEFGIASHPPDARNDNAEGFSDETLMSQGFTKEHENVIPAEAGIQDAGRGLNSHFRGNDGQLEGFSYESGGNPDSSAPSVASMGTGGNCSRSAACMGADSAVSEVYLRPSPGIDESGSRGRGGQGEGLKTFLEGLRVEIDRHKNYPPFARKNGIEGTAYLNFHMGDNGRPEGIILGKSSGSKILDESAIRTLKGMEQFYPVPEEIRELEITVPIAYRLVEDKTPPSP